MPLPTALRNLISSTYDTAVASPERQALGWGDLNGLRHKVDIRWAPPNLIQIRITTDPGA